MSTSVESIESGSSTHSNAASGPVTYNAVANNTQLSRVKKADEVSDTLGEEDYDESAVLDDNEVAPVDAKNLLECLGDRAGMEGVDREKVKQIVHEASIGSKFYENEQRKAKQLQESIDSLVKKAKFYRHDTTTEFREKHKKVASAIVEKLLSTYQTTESSIWQGSCYCHMDMDMFYCAVEQLENPELKDVPMAVGGSGMICTANYAARKFGIRAGMPGFIGMELCPSLVLVRPHFPKYLAKSEKFREIIAMYDRNYLSKSCDEVSMNLTALAEGKSIAFVEELVHEIREKVRLNTGGLTCSAGVGLTPIISKMNSNVNKPNGQFVLYPWQTLERLRTLECRKVPGIGKARAATFEALQIKKLGDVWENADIILYIFPEITASNILRLCTGHHVEMDRERKSSGCEKSFQPSGNVQHLTEMLRHIANKVQTDLERLNCVCGRITLKAKTEYYKSATMTSPLPMFTDKADMIFSIANALFKKYWAQNYKPGLKLRLLGIISTELRLKKNSTSIRSIREFFTQQRSKQISDEVCNEGQSKEERDEVVKEEESVHRVEGSTEETMKVEHKGADLSNEGDEAHKRDQRLKTSSKGDEKQHSMASEIMVGDRTGRSLSFEASAAHVDSKTEYAHTLRPKMSSRTKKRAKSTVKERFPAKIRTLEQWINKRKRTHSETIEISD